MNTSPSAAAERLVGEFDGAWRDDTPVFGCCRKSVATAVERVDVVEVATLDPVERVQALRAALEEAQPGHISAHRCCAGHLADLAFDLPDLLAPAR